VPPIAFRRSCTSLASLVILGQLAGCGAATGTIGKMALSHFAGGGNANAHSDGSGGGVGQLVGGGIGGKRGGAGNIAGGAVGNLVQSQVAHPAERNQPAAEAQTAALHHSH